jgi:hypothetical protein
VTDDRPTLDRPAVERLATDLLAQVRDHYRRRPTSRETVFEILNALAIATGIALEGSGGDEIAHDFFLRALDQQMKGYSKNEDR